MQENLNDQAINNLIKNLDPESYRVKVLNFAKKFKSNWIDFGEFLTKVATEKAYEEWGYKKFEEYCRVELKVKKATAMKLTNAFFFISEHEPELYQSSSEANIPDLDTVTVLQKAKSDTSCTPEIYDELKDFALNKGKSATTLAKKFKELTMTAKESLEDANVELCKTLVQRLIKKTTLIEGFPENHQNMLDELADYFESLTPRTEE